jgi:hypothetical protein
MLITGGGTISADPFSYIGKKDTSGENPQIEVCRRAIADASTASATLASLAPTRSFDAVTINPGEELVIDGRDGGVVEMRSLFIRGRGYPDFGCEAPGVLTLDVEPGQNLLLNITGELRLDRCGVIRTYTGEMTPYLVNVPGRGKGVRIGPETLIEIPVMAPERRVRIEGSHTFEPLTYVGPLWARRLKALGYLYVYSTYFSHTYCGVTPQDDQP